MVYPKGKTARGGRCGEEERVQGVGGRGCDEPERYGTGERAGAFLWWILGLSRAGRQRSGERVSSGCGGLGGLVGRFMPARGPKCSGPLGSARAGRQGRGWWVAEVLGAGCGLVVYPGARERRRAGRGRMLGGPAQMCRCPAEGGRCRGRGARRGGVGSPPLVLGRAGRGGALPLLAQASRHPAEGAGVGEGVIAE